MLNGDIFSELFLSNLDEKITSAGYEKGKLRNKLIILPDNNILVFTLWRFTCKTKYSLTLDNSSLSSQQLVPNYCIYPSKSSDLHFAQIITLPWLAAIFFGFLGDRSRGKDGLPRTTRSPSKCYWRWINCISHDLIGSRSFFCYLTHAMA